MSSSSIDSKYHQPVDMKYNLKVLWRFLRNYKGILAGLLVATIIIEVAVLASSFVFKLLVDNATLVTEGSLAAADFRSKLLLIIAGYILVEITMAIMWYLKLRGVNALDSGVMSDLENYSFQHIVDLSYRFHSNKKTGSIISQFTRGVGKVESFVDAIIFNFLPTIIRISFVVASISYFDRTTAVIVLSMVAVFVTIGFTITNIQKRPQSVANYREDRLKQNLADVFLNIDTVKYFSKEKPTFKNFGALSTTLRKSRINFWRYFSYHAGIQTAVLGTGLTLIFYFSFMNFLEGSLTLGSITFIYASVFKLFPMLFSLMHGYRQYVRSIVDVDALFSMFKQENEVKDLPQARRLRVNKGQIHFNNVSFAYPSSSSRTSTGNIIKQFDLKIKANQKIALVGSSGSGKTTIVRLLYRLYDLNEGSISIDGQDINSVTQHSLRDAMSIVPQEPLLFDNSIYFNVAYANPKASRAQVLKAMKLAQLDKFVATLPQGEKTIVGERGVKLSGGEKQRVSIARAILANKKILVLDEATSALDSETEREIQRDLDKLMKGRTSIIIAHRLSTIMKADVIVVMSKGKIVEVGSHKELKNKRGGLYKRLWSLQQGGAL